MKGSNILAWAGATFVASFLAPLTVSAQPAGDSNVDLAYFEDLVGGIQGIADLLIPLVVSLGLLFFFWGLAVFILNAGDPEARGKGVSIMIWGIVALTVMLSIWGIIELISEIFGIEDIGSVDVPSVGGPAAAGDSVFR